MRTIEQKRLRALDVMLHEPGFSASTGFSVLATSSGIMATVTDGNLEALFLLATAGSVALAIATSALPACIRAARGRNGRSWIGKAQRSMHRKSSMIAGLTSAGDNLSVCVPGYDTWLVFRKDVVVPEIMTCAQFADFERDVARTGEPLWTVQHQSVDDSLLVRRFVGGLLHGTKFDEPGECSVHDRTITRRIWFAEGRECEADDEPDPERAESVPAF